MLEELLAEGIAHHQAGRLAEAAEVYRRVIELDPGQHLAIAMLGTVALQQGDGNRAQELLGRALEWQPNNPEYLFNSALASDLLGDREGAETLTRQTIDAHPKHAGAHNQLGIYLREAGRLDESRKVLSRASRLDPADAGIWINLSSTLGELGQYKDAISAARKALFRAPDHPVAHFNLGRLLGESEQPGDAVAALEKAVRLSPQYADAWASLAKVLISLNRPEEAEHAARQALVVEPAHHVGLCNLGLSLIRQADYRTALEPLRRAVEISPMDSTGVSNLACTLLALGEFEEGWPLYERMLETDEGRHSVFIRDTASPRWRGESLAGKSILVSAEQGIGEQIMFATLIPRLTDAGARVGYACDPRLVPLVERSLPGVVAIGAAVGDSDPGGYEFFSPVGSLPGMFCPDIASFPKVPAFLRPDTTLTDTLRARYRDGHEGPVVGISWRSASRLVGIQKNAPLDMWSPVFSLPGCRFISVQYGDVREEVRDIRDRHGIDIMVDDDIDALKSIDANAAQIAACDLIVSISNATLHIAGACGIPTLALVGRDPNWYWRLEDNGRSVWYESVAIDRQASDESWAPVLARTAAKAEALLDSC